MRLLPIAFALAVAGCSAAPVARMDDPAPRAVVASKSTAPAVLPMQPGPQPQPAMSNGNIATDFLDLHFRLETGRDLAVFTRFETPVTVAVTGNPPATLGPDLARLLSRLRAEAGIDIRQIGAGEGQPNIVIEAVSRDRIRAVFPGAACFVVPNVTSLDDFRRKRGSAQVSWTGLTTRERMGIFVPNDASPQELRDCLHEELAQALGPVNDLYRLSNSVFNDDNIHTVLTPFDMLILRAAYAPGLESGMTRDAVAARLPGILSALNPAGDAIADSPKVQTPRVWIEAVQDTLSHGTPAPQRQMAISRALTVASDLRLNDHRRGFSHYVAGRLIQGTDPVAAQTHFDAARRFFAATPGTDLHQAYLAAQVAAFAITRADGSTALAEIGPALSTARAAENAALVATLMLMKAEALELTGQRDAARAVRVDSMGWARYGFGPDWAVRTRMQEIAALNPAGS